MPALRDAVVSRELAQPGPGPRPAEPTRRQTRIAALVVGAAVLLGLLVVYWYRPVFGPLLIALALAYILEPLVGKIERRGFSRHFAVVCVFLAAALTSTVLVLLVAYQVTELVSFLGQPNSPVREGFEKLADTMTVTVGGDVGDRIQKVVRDATGSGVARSSAEFFANLFTTMGTGLVSAVNLLSILILLPVYLVYLMLMLPELKARARALLPHFDRERTLRVLGELHHGMSEFLRGRVVVALLKGAMTSLGLALCGTPFALAVGMLAGVLSVLPYVGAVIGFASAAAMTVAEQGALQPLLWVAVVFVVAEIVEGYVLTPWIMGPGVQLSPLTMLFCVVFWGYALGLFGALVAIPLTFVLKVLLRAYVLPSVQRLAEAPD
ncbi:MAG: AI-2E family transporter [Planctomycetes bacterium]|nr:AI-2E family transporter [Planctomycetota bacterium]